MRKQLAGGLLAVGLAAVAWGQEPAPSLTIYNQSFAVVRETVPLDLAPGINRVQFTNITAQLEPDSVMLRDAAGQRQLQVLEQNYRADPVSQELLLSLYEGKIIQFLLPSGSTVEGRIVRSGYVPRLVEAGYAQPAYDQPIVEVDGKLRFGLPGQPLFPALTGDTVLKPTLTWQMETDKPGRFNAELSYVTAGLSWEADYNLVAPEKGDVADLVGWITMRNRSGHAFENARIKLLAGDVNKLQPGMQNAPMAAKAMVAEDALRPVVSERSFDEYHMYTLDRAATLHNQEVKQVEFVSATGIASRRRYLYDGTGSDWERYRYYTAEQLRVDRDFGTQANTKVWVVQELVNSQGNHLGMALPRGRLRFYRRDTDGHLEFTGESTIDHTPRDETLRVYTGNAFDLVGQRKRTDFRVDGAQRTADESFEIRLRNHKKEPVTITVLERLYRGVNWEITRESAPHRKTEAQRAEFDIKVPPDAEQVLTYTVHYWW